MISSFVRLCLLFHVAFKLTRLDYFNQLCFVDEIESRIISASLEKAEQNLDL